MADGPAPIHVSLIAIPDAAISTLSGIYDVLNCFAMLAGADPAVPSRPPFKVEIVGERAGKLTLVSGLAVDVQRGIGEIAATDIIIAPSFMLRGNAAETSWEKGRYPLLVEWARAMHAQGASLCSACSGIFLLAETGLFDGRQSTVHWGYASAFRKAHPQVPIKPEQVLTVAGRNQELVSSGASMSWHDLILYLIGRHVGVTAAQSVARYFALQWHQDGLAPYIVFDGARDHGDAAVLAAQDWLATHFSVGSPVEEMVKRAGIPERTFKRRFTNATGLPPIEYVQRLRIEDAKRRLERTEAPADEIAWQVGYEDAASFRRLFKRTTGLTPGAYRRRFQVPGFARGPL